MSKRAEHILFGICLLYWMANIPTGWVLRVLWVLLMIVIMLPWFLLKDENDSQE